MACLRLVTRWPDPLLSVPFLRRRIAEATVLEADFPYFAIRHFPFPSTCRASSASRCAKHLLYQGLPKSSTLSAGIGYDRLEDLVVRKGDQS